MMGYNTSVAAYLNRQGGPHSPARSLRAESILHCCHRLGIRLSAIHIAGKTNILADSLSTGQQVLHTEWTLQKKILQSIWKTPGGFLPMVDLFTTIFNKRLPIYVSPVPDPEALTIDALPPVGRNAMLCLSPVPSHTQSSPLSETGECSDDSDRSSPACAGLVSGTLPLRPPSSRKDRIHQAMYAVGAASGLHSIVQLARRTGTQSQYSKRWSKWVAWCRTHQVDSEERVYTELGTT
ncbi:hypothetical protein ACOMHN_033039 [Nucella lapillus]